MGRLSDAELHTLPGESHLGGLGVGEHILTTLLDVWDASADPVAPSVYRAEP